MKNILLLLLASSAFGAELMKRPDNIRVQEFLTTDVLSHWGLFYAKPETVLSTNWLPISLQQPNGDGTTSAKEKEIGIVVSNRFAQVIADGKTNRILISSEAMPPEKFLVRDKAQSSFTMTNLNTFGQRYYTIPLGGYVTTNGYPTW